VNAQVLGRKDAKTQRRRAGGHTRPFVEASLIKAARSAAETIRGGLQLDLKTPRLRAFAPSRPIALAAWHGVA